MCKYKTLALAVIGSSVLLVACIPKTKVPGPDTTAPTLVLVTAVPTATNDINPDFTFSSNEAGSIIYDGACVSTVIQAIKGSNTISFDTLLQGTYSDCAIRVKDAKGNISAPLVVGTFTVSNIIPRLLNDTGITECGDYAYIPGSGVHNNAVDCVTAGSTQTVAGEDIDGDWVSAGQDAVYGRDASSLTNNDSDGHKGFSFTKLDADGKPLVIQNGSWSDAGSESAGTRWICVQDNVTGLVWEIKTNDNGLRDRDWMYTWYVADSGKNGGVAGTADTGSGTESDNCFNSARCDTEKYMADVNALDICGETTDDWRIPSSEELLGLVAKDRNAPAIDSQLIPNTEFEDYYWTASTYAGANDMAWGVYFADGSDTAVSKSSPAHVRLVRGSY